MKSGTTEAAQGSDIEAEAKAKAEAEKNDMLAVAKAKEIAEAEAKAKAEREAQSKAKAEREALKNERSAQAQLKGQSKIKIIIASGRDSGEQAPVPVGVNGQHYLIERDKEVEVPKGVLNALNLATELVPTFDVHGRVERYVKAQRFNVTVIAG